MPDFPILPTTWAKWESGATTDYYTVTTDQGDVLVLCKLIFSDDSPPTFDYEALPVAEVPTGVVLPPPPPPPPPPPAPPP